MIAFLSLFLGLVYGTHTISLVADDAVERIELAADGVTIAVLEEEPWSLEWDFGDLRPRSLEAVAYDAKGTEIGRVRQWLNLSRGLAVAALGVRQGEKGQGAIAQLSWESLTGGGPRAVDVEFDGESVEVGDPAAIELPSFDPEQLHFLRAELDFGDGVSASAEVAFGGQYLDTVYTGLTAVPVRLDGRRRLPPADKLDGWFAGPDGPARVLATDTDRSEIIVVRSGSSVGDLRFLRKRELGRALPSATWRRSVPFGRQDWDLRVVWPVSRSSLGAQAPFRLFPYSEPDPSEAGGLIRWVTENDPPEELNGAERLADAVAVAGIAATARNRPRVVLLILGEAEPDASELEPSEVRAYLKSLRVPLVVWSTRPAASARLGWGEPEDVSTQEALDRSAERLFQRLDRQRTVWLAGEYLPAQMALASRASGIRLVE